MRFLLITTLVAQGILFGFTAVSHFLPRHRVWPPPSRHSWQLYATWFLSWLSLSGVFLLAVFDTNSMGLPGVLRFGAGIPLLILGGGLIGWGFYELSIGTTLGAGGSLVRSGPYRWSRNPQYLGTWIYLASLVVLSGSVSTAIGCLVIGLWFWATPFVEEPWLADHLGPEYEAYHKSVPRFFGIRSFRSASLVEG